MSFDREDTLKKAEKFLRQGRLEAAIIEYVKVVDDQPRDWATTNTLGDLYVRAGQIDKAVIQYTRIADHFKAEGFYSKAGALYKKLLKLNPQDETSQLGLAQVSHKQGLLADAKAYLNAVAARRRSRGDQNGAASIVVQLGSIDPADFEARKVAARALAEMGDTEGAAARFRGIHDDLLAKKREREAREALRESVRLNPQDRQSRAALFKASVDEGDLESARSYLDLETAGDDPQLLLSLVEVEVKSGRADSVRELLPRLLKPGADAQQRVLGLAWTIVESNPDTAYLLVEPVVDVQTAEREYQTAATLLQDFVARVPEYLPAILKLIEVSVDGGLETTMCEAQGLLADAYLTAGHATEAREIAEDLVAREPWERAHIDRFRRALVMLKVSEPDTVIAERLSGQTPFIATDPFVDGPPKRPLTVDPNLTPANESPAQASNGVAASSPAPSEPEPKPAHAVPAPQAQEAQETIEIDLTGELGGADPSGSEDSEQSAAGEPARETLEQTFADIRSEVQRQSGSDYSAQHMTLARTYLEMRMPDEALGSLEIASRATRFRFEAATLLGRIHMQRGDNTRAIDWLERAAEAPAPNVEAGRAVLYDLATMFEATGETSRALAIFLEIQTEAGEYRDAADRIERLSRVETGG